MPPHQSELGCSWSTVQPLSWWGLPRLEESQETGGGVMLEQVQMFGLDELSLE